MVSSRATGEVCCSGVANLVMGLCGEVLHACPLCSCQIGGADVLAHWAWHSDGGAKGDCLHSHMQHHSGMLHVSSCYLRETSELFGCQQTCHASNQRISQCNDLNPVNLKVKICTDVVTHVAEQVVHIWAILMVQVGQDGRLGLTSSMPLLLILWVWPGATYIHTH